MSTRIGLTGGVASGKSTVSAMLQELGDTKPKDLVRNRRNKFLSMGSKGLAA